MNNKFVFRTALLGCLLFASSFARAEEEQAYAGQILSEPEKQSPKAEIKPLNLTGVMSTPANTGEETDTYFSADEIINNDKLNTVTAVGNVNIIRNDITVIADKVVYNRVDDVVTAVGNVILVEGNGNVVFSDYVRLEDKMSRGSMDNVKVIMNDESRISAKRFRRLAQDNKVMDQAVYTPCDVCSGSDPLWQLKARKVKHYPETKNMVYNDAVLELKGVPVFYTPYFSHPDPTVKRRSGFLIPNISSNNYLGETFTPKYFWAIDDHQDFLFTPSFTTDRGILWGGTYNAYLPRGEISAEGTYLKAETRDNKDNYSEDKRNRGSLFFKGRYEINDYWVADTDINYVSDRYYLKDISLPQKDNTWLTSTARLQGFDNRNYASLAAYYYKLVTYVDLPRQEEKPLVLPLFNYENISDTNQYGAYWQNTFDFASVFRENTNSAQRLTMINAWNLPYTSPYGEKYKLTASLKSDLYYIDSYLNPRNQEYTGTVARVFPQIGLEWRLPFVRSDEDSRQIIEPIIVAVAAPNGGNKVDKIPNEDSQYIEFDDTNILNLDRYAGYDRNDTGSRISYGINWSAYDNIMGRSSAFLAQSYRFKKDEGFGENLDQSSYFSDYVGRINAAPNQYLDLNYRFTLDKDNLKLKYSELTANVGPSNLLRLYVSYIYLRNNQNAIIQGYQERQELYTALHMGLTRDWTARIYNRQDLSDLDKSLEYGGSIIYEDECFKFILDIRRYNYNSPEYDNDYEYTATFVLKTLGSIGSE